MLKYLWYEKYIIKLQTHFNDFNEILGQIIVGTYIFQEFQDNIMYTASFEAQIHPRINTELLYFQEDQNMDVPRKLADAFKIPFTFQMLHFILYT